MEEEIDLKTVDDRVDGTRPHESKANVKQYPRIDGGLFVASRDVGGVLLQLKCCPLSESR